MPLKADSPISEVLILILSRSASARRKALLPVYRDNCSEMTIREFQLVTKGFAKSFYRSLNKCRYKTFTEIESGSLNLKWDRVQTTQVATEVTMWNKYPTSDFICSHEHFSPLGLLGLICFKSKTENGSSFIACSFLLKMFIKS